MDFDTSLLMQRLVKHEKLEYVLYYDTNNIATTGVGHNLESRPLSPAELHAWVMAGKPLSFAQVMDILATDIKVVVREIGQYEWFNELSHARKTAMCDMFFNLGMTKFREFKHMIAALDNGDFDEVAKQMLASDWADEVKGRATELAHMIITDTV